MKNLGRSELENGYIQIVLESFGSKTSWLPSMLQTSGYLKWHFEGCCWWTDAQMVGFLWSGKMHSWGVDATASPMRFPTLSWKGSLELQRGSFDRCLDVALTFLEVSWLGPQKKEKKSKTAAEFTASTLHVGALVTGTRLRGLVVWALRGS